MILLTERQRGWLALACLGVAGAALLLLSQHDPDTALLSLSLIGLGGGVVYWRERRKHRPHPSSFAGVGAKWMGLPKGEALFQSSFENICMPMALLDGQGRICAANGIFRRSQIGALGDRFADLLREDDRKLYLARLSQQRAATAGVQDGLYIHLQSQPQKTWRVCYAPFAAGMIAESRALLILMDVTERQELQAQFAQNQKMQAIGQLAGGVAHDFNNLLTAMIGYADLIMARTRPTDPNFADLNQIKQNANRAADLVRQLLAFSRRQTLQTQHVNLGDLVDGVRGLLSRLLGPTIELKIEHGADLGVVRADPGQMEQVIMNLAVNARDAMPGHGRLHILTQAISGEEAEARGYGELPPGDYVMMAVCDTGCGIPKAHQSKIFEPFFTTKGQGQGTGLGLATVYGIVQQSDGHIFVESEEGRGACFRIFLPRLLESEQRLHAPESLPPKDTTGQGSILLVEDEGPVRQFAARALKAKGYDVDEAADGFEALAKAESRGRPYDLLITDVIMPGMGGGALAERLRGLYPSLKILFISGYADEDFRHQLDGMKDVYFLPKPFSLAQMAEIVKTCFDEGATRH